MRMRAIALAVATTLSVAACSTTANQGGDDVAISDGNGSATQATGSTGGSSTDATGSTAAGDTGSGGTEAGTSDGQAGGATAGETGTTSSGTSSSGGSAGSSGSSGSTSSGGSSTGGTTGGTAGGTSTGTVGQKLVTGSGPGYTEDEIYIGIQLVVDTEAGFAAVGASAAAPDEEGIAEKMVEYINNTGGIAGRTLVPIYHRSEALSGTWATQASGTCAAFTEDNEVIAAVTSATGGSDALWACTSKRGLPLVERNIWPWDDPYFTEAPNMLYIPGKMSSSRWIDHYVNGLEDLGFFEGAKVGILHFDGQPFERLLDGKLLPALARKGIDSPEIATITSPPSVAAFGNMAGEINNALVRFRSLGVTHIVLLENAGILPFFALPSADQQKYYPQWGFSSNDIPLTLNTIPAPDQLANAQGVSWVPPTDVAMISREDDPVRTQREAQCREAYGSNAGHHNGSMCDALLFLQAALNRATSLTAEGLAAATKALGRSYQSPMAHSTTFTNSLFHDGADAIRLFDWQDYCTTVDGTDYGCFQYVSPIMSTPR